MLSVCLITKNEEEFIETCIQSFSTIATEIIIVDSYSTDKTYQIAGKYTSKIYRRKWNDDFAAARNFAISKASCDWILFIDGDELLINANEVTRTIIEEASANTGGFLLERKDIFYQPESGKLDNYSIGIVRLARNLPAIRFQNEVHEEIHTSIEKSGLEIKIAKSFLLVHQVNHYSISQLTSKQKKYLSMLNKSLKKKVNDSWALYHKAKTLWYLEQRPQAMELYIFLTESETTPKKIRAGSFNHLSILLMEANRLGESRKAIEKSINLINNQSLIYMIKFDVLYAEGNYKEALEALSNVKTKIDDCNYQSIVPGDLYQQYDNVKYKEGCVYLASNQPEKAVNTFSSGIKVNPYSLSNHYGLAISYVKLKQYEIAIYHIKICIQINPEWLDAQVLEEYLEGF